MTYHVVPLPPPRAAVRMDDARVPVALAYYPLALASQESVARLPATKPALSPQVKALVAVIVIIAIVLAILWWLDRLSAQNRVRRNPSPVQKQSTAQMAKNLYQRLQARGGVDETAMRSLAQLSRNA
jgi:hypothetical protein